MKMDLRNYTLSSHLVNERSDRMFEILCGGLGEVVKEYHRVERNSYELLTSTGVLVVLNHTKKIVITMYYANIDQMKGIYKTENIPNYLVKLGMAHTNKKLQKGA